MNLTISPKKKGLQNLFPAAAAVEIHLPLFPLTGSPRTNPGNLLSKKSPVNAVKRISGPTANMPTVTNAGRKAGRSQGA